MCQIQIIKKLGKEKISKEDLHEFIRLMALGDLRNRDAFGLFNHEYSFKIPGGFSYRMIKERKLLKKDFIVGHNRLATEGECYIEMDCPIPCPIPSPLFGNDILPTYTIPGKNYNNHPFTLGKFVMVHNGIIFNHKKIRKKYKIKTEIETDSYIFLYLIDFFFLRSNKEKRIDKVIEAIKKTAKIIDGTYSIVLYDKELKKMFYFRNYGARFTFCIVKKTLFGSTNRKNLQYIYRDKKRKMFDTEENAIYEIGLGLKNPVKKVGEIEIEEEKDFSFFKKKKLKGGVK